MKDFTNNNFNANEFVYKDEARVRGISLKGLIIILIIVGVIFGQIAEEFDLAFSFNKEYTIYEIEDMAEEFLDDAEDYGYKTRQTKELYVKRKLKEKGVEVDRYNITVDLYDNVDVEAK